MSAASVQTEAFPSVAPPHHQATVTMGLKSHSQTANEMRQHRRRKSSSLGGDPRGDTGANALATANLKQTTPPSTPSTPHHPKEKGRKRRKAKNLLSRSKRLALKHTWLVPLILTLTILAAYFVYPGEQNPLHSAIFLSYANPPLSEHTSTLPAHIGTVTQYGKGPKDFAFVAFYTIVLSFTREFLMQRLIRPIAIRAGIRSRGKQSRFMEQFYTAIYFALFGPFGLWVMSRTPVWYFDTAGMYEGFPHRAHEAYFKAYYLLQASYWAQQGMVLMLMLEKPRKDFKELVLHHIVTLALIGLSYRFHFTYMGVAIYVTHDVSDFFLATSKVLNYVDSAFTPPYFALFICIWAYLRHFINLRILYSLSPISIFGLGTPNEFATVGPYDLDWLTQQYKCWISQGITFALLAVLQAVNVFWFFLICRILARLLWKGPLRDERSDEEDEGEDERDGEEGDVVEGEKKEEKKKGKLMNGHAHGNGNGEVTKPKVMVNGKPLGSGEGKPQAQAPKTSAVETNDRKATLRKR